MKRLKLAISMLLVVVSIFSVTYHPLTLFESASAGKGGGNPPEKSATTATNVTSPPSSATEKATSTLITAIRPVVDFSLSYIVSGGGNASAPWFEYFNNSIARNITLSPTPTHYDVDVNSTWSVETVILGIPGERWTLTSANSTGAATANTNLAFQYAHQYRLMTAVDPVGAGTTTPQIGRQVWNDSESVVQVQASPNPGFTFDYWTCEGIGCVSSSLNLTQVTLSGPTRMTAHFVQLASVIIQSLNGKGSLFIDHSTTVPVDVSSPYVTNWRVNSTHTIQALAGSCGFDIGAFHGCVYSFQEWLVNGTTTVSNATYQIEVSDKPTTIIAVYYQDYTNLKIAVALAIGIMAAVVYLRPKKQLASQRTVTRGLSYQYGYLTDVGKVRAHNEDSIIAMEISATFSSIPMSVLLCAIADGVGGARKGEVASQLTIQTVTAELLRRVGSATDLGQALKGSIEAANEAVANYGMEHRESEGLATTIVASILDGRTAYIAHVGDSRAYFLNRAGIRQLTKDHSQVQEMIDTEQLTPEQARHHPARNVITRAVGGATDVQASLMRTPLEPGDRILLCSDGLWSSVSDAEILQIVFQLGNSQSACNQLVSLANQRGGRDNISVIIVEAKIPDETLKT